MTFPDLQDPDGKMPPAELQRRGRRHILETTVEAGEHLTAAIQTPERMAKVAREVWGACFDLREILLRFAWNEDNDEIFRLIEATSSAAREWIEATRRGAM